MTVPANTGPQVDHLANPHWYPGCPEHLGLPAPPRPDPNSAKFQKTQRRLDEMKDHNRAARQAAKARKKARQGMECKTSGATGEDGDDEVNEVAADDEASVEGGEGAGEEVSADNAPSRDRDQGRGSAKPLAKDRDLASFLERSAGAPFFVLDCEWETAMSDKELSTVVRSFGRVYGSNRKAERPFRLLLSGVAPGSRTESQLQGMCGFEHWGERVRVEAAPYYKLFPASRLLYLSPDADRVLDNFDDPDAVYVVGALKDSGRLVGQTQKKADLQGIRSARLPIQEHLDLKGAACVLTVNHMMDIALDRRGGRSWADALEAHVPQRRKR